MNRKGKRGNKKEWGKGRRKNGENEEKLFPLDAFLSGNALNVIF